jgi:hypothetical protein
MLYVVPDKVINGMFEGLFLLVLFAGYIAYSAKTGFVGGAGASRNLNNASEVRLYNDKSQLDRFYKLILATFILSTVLAIALYGFDANYFGTAIVWATFITVPSALPYWCLIILKAKDKK